MQKAVGQRWAQVPAVGGALRRVGGGHDVDASGEQEIADAPLEGHAQHGCLDRGRRGRQFVEEQVAGLSRLQALGPGRWLQADAVVGDDWQSGEVARLSQRADDGLAWHAVGLGGRPELGLVAARCVRKHGQYTSWLIPIGRAGQGNFVPARPAEAKQ